MPRPAPIPDRVFAALDYSDLGKHIDEIALDTNLSRREVLIALRELTDVERIEIVTRHNGVTAYRVRRASRKDTHEH